MCVGESISTHALFFPICNALFFFVLFVVFGGGSEQPLTFYLLVLRMHKNEDACMSASCRLGMSALLVLCVVVHVLYSFRIVCRESTPSLLLARTSCWPSHIPQGHVNECVFFLRLSTLSLFRICFFFPWMLCCMLCEYHLACRYDTRAGELAFVLCGAVYPSMCLPRSHPRRFYFFLLDALFFLVCLAVHTPFFFLAHVYVCCSRLLVSSMADAAVHLLSFLPRTPVACDTLRG